MLPSLSCNNRDKLISTNDINLYRRTVRGCSSLNYHALWNLDVNFRENCLSRPSSISRTCSCKLEISKVLLSARRQLLIYLRLVNCQWFSETHRGKLHELLM